VALIKAEFAGNDVLIGGTAFDILEGLGGHDQLRGMDGPDTLVGGAGNDVIVGGSGKDALIGGPGFDRFRLEEASDSTLLYRDVIRDFRGGENKLDLSKIDADAYGAAGNQAFRFIGGRPFSGEPGELRFEKGVVSGDVTGGGYPEFAIRVAGPTFMSAADFVL
jgi:serralysin